jgi:hypothetical protein
MTHSEFNQLLGSIKALSPELMRQLRQRLDGELAHHDSHAGGQPRKQPERTSGKGAKRAKAAPKRKRTLTEEEFYQHLLSIGLDTSLPDPVLDIDDDDPEDAPVAIEGEPLSGTIIRERR